MKYLEYLKLLIGLILVSFPIIIGVIFIHYALSDYHDWNDIYNIFLKSVDDHNTEMAIHSSVFIFLGMCAFSGSYLLASVKSKSKI